MRTPLSAFYVEDPFQHLVAMTIDLVGELVVVMGTQINDPAILGKRYMGKPAADPKPDEPPQDWRLISENNVEFLSQSFAVIKNPANPTESIPVFLLGCSSPDRSEIHYSTDGETWRVVFSEPRDGANGLTGISWDAVEKKFYAFHDTTSPVLQYNAALLSSFDGQSWTVDQRFVAETLGELDEVTEQAVQAFIAHCKKPENRGDVPDGLQGYDAANGIFIKSKALQGWYTVPFFDPDARGITIEGGPGPSGLPDLWVLGISFAAGTWNAVLWDHTAPSPFPVYVYVSSDGGKTWVRTFSTTGFQPAGIASGDIRGTAS